MQRYYNFIYNNVFFKYLNCQVGFSVEQILYGYMGVYFGGFSPPRFQTRG